MARSKFSKTKEQREKEVNELSEMLKEGVEGFLNSESYKDLLDNLAMFHQYSWRNSILIMLQNPKATYCASYKDWKEKFNRQVQSTSEVGHGYKILVPTFRKVYQTEMDEKGNPILDEEGNEVRTFTGKKALAGYVQGTVHDISQTKQIEGKPVINLDMGSMIHTLDGTIDEYQDLMSALGNISPARMQFEDIQNGSNGYFSPSENRIAIKKGLSNLHTIKTYIHEISHAMIHNNSNINEFKKQGIELTAHDKETQAESIAYIVCKHLGIDSSDYSFGYVAGWAGNSNTLEANLNIIKNTSSQIIDAIDKVLEERQLSKEWQVDFDLKWSETSLFKDFASESNPNHAKLTFAEANELIRQMDAQYKSDDYGYIKTAYTIIASKDGSEPYQYDGRIDIGDGIGSIIDYINSFLDYYAKKDENEEYKKFQQEFISILENASRLTDTERTHVSQLSHRFELQRLDNKLSAIEHYLAGDEWYKGHDCSLLEKIDELHRLGEMSGTVFTHIVNNIDVYEAQVITDIKYSIHEHKSDTILATKYYDLPKFLNEHDDIYIHSLCNVLELDSLDQEMEIENNLEI